MVEFIKDIDTQFNLLVEEFKLSLEELMKKNKLYDVNEN